MSENYADTDYDSSDVDDLAEDGGDIKSLRRAANSKKKLEQELNEVRRELAFTRAGINPDDPKMRYFVKGYDGEMTADAVRQAAMESGFLASQQQGPDPMIQAVSSAQQRVMTASAGAVIEDSTEEAAMYRMQQAMEEGGMEAMLDVARQYGLPTTSEQ